MRLIQVGQRIIRGENRGTVAEVVFLSGKDVQILVLSDSNNLLGTSAHSRVGDKFISMELFSGLDWDIYNPPENSMSPKWHLLTGQDAPK